MQISKRTPHTDIYSAVCVKLKVSNFLIVTSRQLDPEADFQTSADSYLTGRALSLQFFGQFLKGFLVMLESPETLGLALMLLKNVFDLILVESYSNIKTLSTFRQFAR